MPDNELIYAKHPDVEGYGQMPRAALSLPDNQWQEVGPVIDGLPQFPPTPPAELKGSALDDTLDALGLSKSGSATEKRARLAEAQTVTADAPNATS